MKHIKSSAFMLLFLLLIIFHNQTSFAEEDFWEYLGGPETGITEQIAASSDGTIFIGTYNGIYKSNDNGESWLPSLTPGKITSMVISPNNTVYAFKDYLEDKYGTYMSNPKIFYSNDGGTIWDTINQPWGTIGGGDADIWRLAVDENERLYVAYYHNKPENIILAYTDDKGNNWVKNECIIDSVYQFSWGNGFGFNENGELYLICIDNGSIREKICGFLMFSNDLGKTWVKTDSIYGGIHDCIFYGTDTIIAVGSTQGLLGIYASKDKGRHWEHVGFENDYVNHIIKLNENEIIASGNFKFFYSSDKGITWTCYDMDPVIGVGISNDLLYSNERLFSICLGTIISDDKGKNWRLSNKGIYASNVISIAFDHLGNVCALTATGIYKSADKGVTWELFFDIPKIMPVFTGLFVNNNNNDIILCYHFLDTLTGEWNYRLIKSTDSGNSWYDASKGLENYRFLLSEFFVTKTGRIIAHSQNPTVFLYYSDDNGDSWTPYYHNMPAIMPNCMAMNSEGDIFFGTFEDCRIYKSTDNGIIWDSVFYDEDAIVGMGSMNDIIFNKDSIGYCGGRHLYKTTDNGRTWFIGDQGKVDGAKCLVLDSTGTIWNFYDRRNEQTNSWEKYNSGYWHEGYYYNTMGVSPDGYIYLAPTDGGIYRSKYNYLSINDESNIKNEEIFKIKNEIISDYLEIEFSKPLTSEYNFRIYDLAGNEVKYYSSDEPVECVKLDVGNLTSGLYFITLTGQNNNEAQKFIVIR